MELSLQGTLYKCCPKTMSSFHLKSVKLSQCCVCTADAVIKNINCLNNNNNNNNNKTICMVP